MSISRPSTELLSENLTATMNGHASSHTHTHSKGTWGGEGGDMGGKKGGLRVRVSLGNFNIVCHDICAGPDPEAFNIVASLK